MNSSTDYFDNIVAQIPKISLERHPFSLPVGKDGEIFLLPRFREGLGMIFQMHHVLRHGNDITHLRCIFIEERDDPDDESETGKNGIPFFEFGSNQNRSHSVYICRGEQDLQDIKAPSNQPVRFLFALFSLMYQKEIEVVLLPKAKAQRGLQFLTPYLQT